MRIPFGPPSQFAANNILTLERQGVDVDGDDILQNFRTKELQKMNETVPWSGPRKRNLLLLQMLIEAASQLGDLVLDCTSTIGNLLPSLRLILNILCHLFLRIRYIEFLTLIFDMGFYHFLSEVESIRCGLGGG
jgi:hypothetical protein